MHIYHIFTPYLFTCLLTYLLLSHTHRYIYIYIRVIIPVRRWAKCHACHPKWVSAVFESAEKLFSHFSLTSSSCLEQMRLLVSHKSCRCYSHFCTPAKHSALTLCQAFCAMLQQRELEFFAFGRVVSFKSAAPTHGCFDLSYPILGTVVTTGHEKLPFGLLH